MESLAERLEKLKERIERAKLRSGRSDSVTLLGVTKTVAPERVDEARLAGLELVGENRLQEALPKMEALKGNGLKWHFIGTFQGNKSRKCVENFSMIQSIGKRDHLERLSRALKDLGGGAYPVLLEVNIGKEPQKSGFLEEELALVLEERSLWPEVEIQGLMAVPPFDSDPRPFFKRMRKLFEQGKGLKVLSMGMSEDFETAVEEGATMVRLGRALFGERRV